MKKNKKIIIILSSIIFLLILSAGLYFSITNMKFKVTFNSNGGNTIKSITVKYGSKVKLPEPEYKGYEFIGWSLDDKILSKEIIVKHNIKLDAKWKKIVKETFEVIFDTDGGNKIDSIIVIKGEKLTLPIDPVKEGYTFVNWKDKDGNIIENNMVLKVEKEIVLKAYWKKNSEEEVPLPQPTKKYTCPEGYTLKGIKCHKTLVENASCKCPPKYNPKNGKCGYMEPTFKVCKTSQHGQGFYKKENNKCYFNPSSEPANCSDEFKFEDYCYKLVINFNDIPGAVIEHRCYVGSKICISGRGCFCVDEVNLACNCNAGYKLNKDKCEKKIEIAATLK